jgi:hypothetical protein
MVVAPQIVHRLGKNRPRTILNDCKFRRTFAIPRWGLMATRGSNLNLERISISPKTARLPRRISGHLPQNFAENITYIR